jgi:hypothetical protein
MATFEDVMTLALPPFYERSGAYPQPLAHLKQFCETLQKFLREDYVLHSSSANNARLSNALRNIFLILFGRELTTYVSCGTGWRKANDPFSLLCTSTTSIFQLLRASRSSKDSFLRVLADLSSPPCSPSSMHSVPLHSCMLPPLTKDVLCDYARLVELRDVEVEGLNDLCYCTCYFKDLYGFSMIEWSGGGGGAGGGANNNYNNNNNGANNNYNYNYNGRRHTNHSTLTKSILESMSKGADGYAELFQAYSAGMFVDATSLGKMQEKIVLYLSPLEYYYYTFISYGVRGYGDLKIFNRPNSSKSKAWDSYRCLLKDYVYAAMTVGSNGSIGTTGSNSNTSGDLCGSVFMSLLMECVFCQMPLVPGTNLSHTVMEKKLADHKAKHGDVRSDVFNIPPCPRLKAIASELPFIADTSPHGLYSDMCLIIVSQMSCNKNNVRGVNSRVYKHQRCLYPWLIYHVNKASVYKQNTRPNKIDHGEWIPPAVVTENYLIVVLNVWMRYVKPWGYSVAKETVAKETDKDAPSEADVFTSYDPDKLFNEAEYGDWVRANHHFYVDVFLVLVNRIAFNVNSFVKNADAAEILNVVKEVVKVIIAVKEVLAGNDGSAIYSQHLDALGGWRNAQKYSLEDSYDVIEKCAVELMGASLDVNNKDIMERRIPAKGANTKAGGSTAPSGQKIMCEFANKNNETTVSSIIKDLIQELGKVVTDLQFKEKVTNKATKNINPADVDLDALAKRDRDCGLFKFDKASIKRCVGEWEKPLGTFEIGWLFRLARKLSNAVNDALRLIRGYIKRDETINDAPRLKHEHVSLRFLADMRNLGAIALLLVAGGFVYKLNQRVGAWAVRIFVIVAVFVIIGKMGEGASKFENDTIQRVGGDEWAEPLRNFEVPWLFERTKKLSKAINANEWVIMATKKVTDGEPNVSLRFFADVSHVGIVSIIVLGFVYVLSSVLSVSVSTMTMVKLLVIAVVGIAVVG